MRAINFQELLTKTAERRKPFDAKERRIAEAYYAWQRREDQRGANITTTTPPEVDEAIAKVNRERAASLSAFYDAQAPTITAELDARTAEISALYDSLVAAMADLDRWQRDAARFATACGVAPTRSLADEQINSTRAHDWKARVARTLHPPVPAPRMRAAENPLVLNV